MQTMNWLIVKLLKYIDRLHFFKVSTSYKINSSGYGFTLFIQEKTRGLKKMTTYPLIVNQYDKWILE